MYNFERRHPNVFLSGPMTNKRDYNLHEFCNNHVAMKLAGAGHVYNPALIWLQEPEYVSETKTHDDYMLECLHEMSRTDEQGRPFYDIIAQLEGWEMSKGACAEDAAAAAMGIPRKPATNVIRELQTLRMAREGIRE